MRLRSFSQSRMAVASVLAVLAAPAMAQADTVNEMLGVPGPVSFMGDDYTLVWSSRPNDGYVKQEYLPAGQDLETYSRMLLIEAVVAPVSPLEAAVTQVQSLEARKSFDPVVNHELIQNDATGEVLLDFVVSDLSADPIVVEWNAYRYVELDGEDGVALFAISLRGYGEEGATQFLSGLGETRTRAINALAGYDLPAIAVSR